MPSTFGVVTEPICKDGLHIFTSILVYLILAMEQVTIQNAHDRCVFFYGHKICANEFGRLSLQMQPFRKSETVGLDEKKNHHNCSIFLILQSNNRSHSELRSIHISPYKELCIGRNRSFFNDTNFSLSLSVPLSRVVHFSLLNIIIEIVCVFFRVQFRFSCVLSFF